MFTENGFIAFLTAVMLLLTGAGAAVTSEPSHKDTNRVVEYHQSINR